MRLDRFLANEGIGSRKEVKQLLKSGLVTVNDQVIKSSAYKIDPLNDQVLFNGQLVEHQPFVYLMLNKPQGVISATEDNIHQTVIDCLNGAFSHLKLFPVGRLDIDTTGLLLITNDGQLAHHLLSPKKKVFKQYAAKIDGIVTQDDIDLFAKGLDLGDFVSLPAKLFIDNIDSEQQTSQIRVEIQEGKYHQVKRMFQAVNKEVLTLNRLSMGPLQLNKQLRSGEWRELTQNEMLLLEDYM